MSGVLEELQKDSVADTELAYQAAQAILQRMAGEASPSRDNSFSIMDRTIGGQSVSTAESQAVHTKLFLAEARYRTLVEQLPVVTFLAALDGGVNELYVSPQIEALLGFSQKEWLEDPILWYTQLHPDDRERWHIEFARTCATGERFRSEYRFLARDGRVVWVHGEAQLVRDRAGHPLFLQGMAYDITERKRAEEALQALNTELEKRVRD